MDKRQGYHDQRTQRIDGERYEAVDGPCLHAARTRSIVLLDSDEAMGRWPLFAAGARKRQPVLLVS